MAEERLQVEVPEAFVDLYEPSRYKIFYGGRGAGKSWQFGRAAVVLSLSKRVRVLCVREIQKSISDSVHKLLTEQIHELGLDKYFKITKDTIVGVNGSEFIFKGLHGNANEIKSTEGVDICWVEEGQSVTADSWDILIPTIRKEHSEIWVTFNPLNESDATYQKFIIEKPYDALVKKVNYWDNPYFPEVLLKEMQWLKEKDYQAYLHIWEGECRKISKALVFGDHFRVDEFDTPDGVRFYHGADWGFANDPTTLVRCFIQGRTIYIDAEAWGVGVDLDETPALFDIIPTARKWPIKADSARPETISFMKRRGFNISAAKKWQGSVEDGVEWLKSYDIVIHPRCKHTIDEFEHYSYKQDKVTGDILPVILDKFNHCLDALRYAFDGLIKGKGGMTINPKALQ